MGVPAIQLNLSFPFRLIWLHKNLSIEIIHKKIATLTKFEFSQYVFDFLHRDVIHIV